MGRLEVARAATLLLAIMPGLMSARADSTTKFQNWSLEITKQGVMLAQDHRSSSIFGCYGNGLAFGMKPYAGSATAIKIACTSGFETSLSGSDAGDGVFIADRTNASDNSYKIMRLFEELAKPGVCWGTIDEKSAVLMVSGEFASASKAFLAACDARGQLF